MPAAIIASRMRRLIDTADSRSTVSVIPVALASTISSLVILKTVFMLRIPRRSTYLALSPGQFIGVTSHGLANLSGAM
ncbi:MAG: hypothetical protein OXE87_17665 [Chloroflexi bacterium]|nr:hypothetical protein [Chloroflexota bacterium]